MCFAICTRDQALDAIPTPAYIEKSRRTGGPLKPAFGLSGVQHFWQERYYDFNIRNHPQFVEKLRYIHRNPVRAGLCLRRRDREWSSFRHYATGCEGVVQIESGLDCAKARQGDSVWRWKLPGLTSRPNEVSAQATAGSSGQGEISGQPLSSQTRA
jgi:hypothetical protein